MKGAPVLKNLSDNLNMLMAKARLSSSELARQTGLPATTIKRIRNNEQSNPTITTLEPIAKYFSITIGELLEGAALGAIIDLRNAAGKITVPLLSWKNCAKPVSIERTSYPQISMDRQISNHGFALQIEDRDLDLFPYGGVIIIDPDEKPFSGDYVLVTKVDNDIVSIRRYIVDIEQIYLKPLVKGLNIVPLTHEYRVIGVIVQYKMELKSKIS